MGTNYYAVKNRPSCQDPIHIGKSSAGWMFHFERQNLTWVDPPVAWNTWNQIKKWLADNSDKYVIVDEYDEIIPLEELIDLVETKQKDSVCNSNPDNFSNADNVDGYRFSNCPFS